MKISSYLYIAKYMRRTACIWRSHDNIREFSARELFWNGK